LPGVTYPESLSSGLTSKRTSHKIAEQGRRNRINDALKEMQALLPRPSGKTKGANGNGTEDERAKSSAADDEDCGEKDSPKGGGATSESKSASSKAATVESAIEYIKSLQRERLETDYLLKTKDAEMASLRRRLQDAGLGSADSNSTDADVAAAAAAASSGSEQPDTKATETIE